MSVVRPADHRLLDRHRSNSPTSSATPSSSAQPFQRGGTLENLEACVLGHWIHSHEEDTPGIAIYRPREYEFPPARGRTGFDFIASGKAVYYDIADSDGGKSYPGVGKCKAAMRSRLRLTTSVLSRSSCTF